MVAPIEFIENVIAIYGQATAGNLSAPGRDGNVVVVTDELADEVMITGDLHGHRANYEAICRIADLDGTPGRHLILQEVCHGGPTYPANGGCMSHTMLEDVAKLIVEYPGRVHFILGNHELAELTDYPIQKNKQMLNLMFRLGLQQVYGPATEKVREAYFPFLRSCPLAVRMPGGIFASHSVPDNVDSRPFDTSIFTRKLELSDYHERTGIFEMVWGRDYRQENADAFADMVDAKVLINGHEPCIQGFNAVNSTQLILDCCGEKACYVILPTDRELDQAEIVDRIGKIV